MHTIPRSIVEKFAEAFTGTHQGLSGQEITDFFQQYDMSVRSYDHYGFKPARFELFIESLYVLPTNEQYFALTDLCNNPPASKTKRYAIPSQQDLQNLKALLHNHLSVKPVGLSISLLNSKAIREAWLEANSRIPHSPSSAITSARTLLETTCSTILTERSQTPDASGDLSRLYKQCRQILGVDAQQSDGQALHQMLGGMTNVVNGIAGLSNMAGDRHGLPQGIKLDDPILAMTSVNAAGTICLFLVHIHLFLPI
jgi:hypothetical protein